MVKGNDGFSYLCYMGGIEDHRFPGNDHYRLYGWKKCFCGKTKKYFKKKSHYKSIKGYRTWTVGRWLIK